MLVWLVFLTVGAVLAATSVAVTAVVHRHGDRARHGAVHGAARALERELAAHPSLRGFVRRRVSPTELTGLLLSLALLALVAIGLLGFEVRRDSAVVRLDRSVAQWAADHATDASTTFLRWFTDLGSTLGVVVITLGVAVVARRRIGAGAIAFLAIAVVGANVATNLLKLLVERTRPDVGRFVAAHGFSYPSGHSSSAAVCFAAAALCLGRGRSRPVQTALTATAAALAGMVAASRVLLDAHWLSDVVAGLALGAAWFALCAIAFGGRLLRFGAPAEMAARVEVLDRAAREHDTHDDRHDAEHGTDDRVGQPVHAEHHSGDRDGHSHDDRPEHNEGP